MYISCVWLEFYCIPIDDSPSSHLYIWFVMCQMLYNIHLTRPNKIKSRDKNAVSAMHSVMAKLAVITLFNLEDKMLIFWTSGTLSNWIGSFTASSSPIKEASKIADTDHGGTAGFGGFTSLSTGPIETRNREEIPFPLRIGTRDQTVPKCKAPFSHSRSEPRPGRCSAYDQNLCFEYDIMQILFIFWGRGLLFDYHWISIRCL